MRLIPSFARHRDRRQLVERSVAAALLENAGLSAVCGDDRGNLVFKHGVFRQGKLANDALPPLPHLQINREAARLI